MRAKTVVSLGGQDVDLTDDNVSYALWKLGDLRILVRLRMCGYLPAQQVFSIARAIFFKNVICGESVLIKRCDEQIMPRLELHNS
jgi:hypothetical protein